MKYLLLILGLSFMVGCKKEVVTTEKVQKEFFYRLVTKDLDGTVTYSNVATTKVEFEIVTTYGSGIESGTQTNDDPEEGEDDPDEEDPLGTPLPLLLEYFKVSTKGHTVMATWKTTFEDDVVCFYLERSDDGVKYTKVKTITPKGPGEYFVEDVFTN